MQLGNKRQPPITDISSVLRSRLMALRICRSSRRRISGRAPVVQCRSRDVAHAEALRLPHRGSFPVTTGHPRLWMMARVTNEKDGYRE